MGEFGTWFKTQHQDHPISKGVQRTTLHYLGISRQDTQTGVIEGTLRKTYCTRRPCLTAVLCSIQVLDPDGTTHDSQALRNQLAVV